MNQPQPRARAALTALPDMKAAIIAGLPGEARLDLERQLTLGVSGKAPTPEATPFAVPVPKN